MTITEFLLARVAEDEAAAEAANKPGVVSSVSGGIFGSHTIRHGPARVLAECEAKRRIVEQWAATAADDAEVYPGLQSQAQGTLEALAAVYAGHPGYRQEWAL